MLQVQKLPQLEEGLRRETGETDLDVADEKGLEWMDCVMVYEPKPAPPRQLQETREKR